MKLRQVAGTGFNHSQEIIWSLQTEDIVYIVNNVAVFYNSRLNRQTRLIQRPSAITSISCDQSGKYIAIAESHTISVYDLSDESELCRQCTISSLDDYNVAVRLFPDCSTMLAISSEKDFNIRLWDWRSGTLITSATSSYSMVAFDLAPNATGFATCGDAFVSFWQLNGAASTSITIQESVLKTIAATNAGLLEDSTFVSVGIGKGKSASRIFALTSKAVLCRFSLQRRTLEKWVDLKLESGFSIAVTDNLIAIGGSGGRIRLFTPDTISHISTISSDIITSDVLSISFNHDHSKIACIYSTNMVTIWDAMHSRMLRQFGFHSGVISEIISFTNGDAVSCCNEGQVRRWSDSIDEIVFVFDHGSYPTAIAKSSDERQVIIGDSKGSLRQWHRNTSSGELTLIATIASAHDGQILCADFNFDAALLCSGGQDESIRIFDARKQLAPIGTFMDHCSPVEAARFVSSSDILVSASSDGTYLRDIASFSSESLQFLPNLIAPFIPGPNASPFCISVDRSGRAVIWDVNSKQVLQCIGEDIQDIAIHPTGALIALSRSDFQISIIDWFSYETVSRIASSLGTTKVRFSENGQKLFTFGDDNCIFIWDIGSQLNQLVSERLQEMESEQRALIPFPMKEDAQDNLSNESFIEFSESESEETVYTPPGLSPAQSVANNIFNIKDEMLSTESPERVEISPRKISKPKRETKTCWRSSLGSLSPKTQITTLRFRPDYREASSKIESVEDVVAELKASFLKAKEIYRQLHQAGDDVETLSRLFRTMKSEIACMIKLELGETSESVALDPETTKSALDIYSGKLIELIQSKVDEAVNASIGSRLMR